MKKKTPKRVRKARNKEYKIIVRIISDALIRILSRRTTKTFNQELHFISKQIEEFVKTAYITRTIHVKEMLEQHFGAINLLEKAKKIWVNDDINPDIIEGLDAAIKIIKGSRK